MKTRKRLLTLISIAAIGLSSTALTAEGDGDRMQQRDRVRVDIEITPELQEMIAAFRAQRQELMAKFREFRMAHRESMAELWVALKDANENGTPEDVEAAKTAIKKAHVDFRAEYGQDIRQTRHSLRDLKRQFREKIREQKDTVEGEG